MPRTTITQDITILEAELTSLRLKISEQEAVRSIEEGGSGARFRTDFTDISTLYARETDLVNRLNILYSYQERY